ncbi:MAG: tungstate ABC transporter substrate-binding protein WtpA [Desulfobacterales bacterium]
MRHLKAIRPAAVFILAALIIILASGSAPVLAKTKVKIFHAGSLTVPLAEMEKRFEAENPDIDIQREAGGSTKMARLISEVGKTADIMASADYEVIDKTLRPEHAGINIRFASNQLVLTYTSQSRYADEINTDNWYEILKRDDVQWGHSDENLDPCGYRSLMVLKLAEKYYDKPGLYEKLVANCPKENIRPKSVELVSLLESGHMDYAWEYLSVAVQHNLKYIKLPDKINLGNYQYDDFYSQAKVKVTGDEPGTWTTRTGKSCTYGITLIKNAPARQAAIAFLDYLLDPDGGLKILDQMGQPPFIPARVPNREMKEQLPEVLQDRVVVKE